MQGQTNKKIVSNKLQNKLRNTPTDAERTLWQHLRQRQLERCKFRRQHPYGDYILDFVCLERKVIVEVDGSQHADNLAYDQARTGYLERGGFTVLRFWNNEIFDNIEGVIEVILTTLTRHTIPTQPAP